MRILLTNVNRGEQRHLYFPLGLAYVAAPLRKDGHGLAFLDVQALSLDDIPAAISKHTFDVVCISALITDFKFVQWFSRLVKERFPGVKVVLGGGLSTVSELLLKKSDVDVTVCQEGEETVVELMRAFADNSPLSAVKGIFYKDAAGEIKSTGRRAPIEDLDSIDFPAYDVFSVDRYLRTEKLGFSHPVKSLSVITTRGCPYSCVFCDKGVWGGNYRARSPENILKEVEHLKKRYGVEAVVFSDDLFVLDKKRVHALCDLMIENKTGIAWSCNGRVNLMDEPLLKKMKAAGCMTIAYGLESGSQRMLDVMKKRITVEQSRRAIALTRKHGIDIQPYLVLNMIGEDEESIGETVGFCKEMGLPVGKFGLFTPLPNTELYAMADRAVGMPPLDKQIEQWRDWNDGLTVNLSRLPDDRLLELKSRAESEIRDYYVRHHKRLILRRFMLRYRQMGLRVALGVFQTWVGKYMKYQKRKSA
ncbi:MAG: radical SAM protein [Deltaproteobacteria bacterium]|nr:radical SAM protein [Deltaproteobacteria bacterium]